MVPITQRRSPSDLEGLRDFLEAEPAEGMQLDHLCSSWIDLAKRSRASSRSTMEESSGIGTPRASSKETIGTACPRLAACRLRA